MNARPSNSGAATAEESGRAAWSFQAFDRVVVPLLLVLAVFLAYRPVLDNGYSGWDESLLFEHSDAISRFFLPEVWRAFFSPLPDRAYYPLYRISIAFDIFLWGRGAFGHHLTSLLLHALATLLVYALGLRLFAASPTARVGPLVPAAIGALLFAVHPVNVEPVAWICGRKVQLAVLFSLLSFWCYLSESRHWAWRPLTVGCFACACLSNAVTASLPLVVIAHDALLGQRPWWRAIAARLDLVAVAVGATIARMALVRVETDLPGQEWAFVRWFPLTCRSLWDHIASLVWPAKLSNLYEMIYVEIFAPESLLGYVAVGLAVSMLWILRKRALPAFLVLWFLLGIAPSAAHHFGHADRFLYFPAIGLFWLVGLGLASLLSVHPSSLMRSATVAVCAAMVVPLTLTCRRQCTVWHDPVTLWRHAVSVTPRQWAAHLYLGLALAADDKVEESLPHVRRALALEPRSGIAHHALARSLVRTGDTEAAIAVCREALKMPWLSPEIRYGLASILGDVGEVETAKREYLEVIRLGPKKAEAHNNLGLLLSRQGKSAAAEHHFREALRHNPRLVQARANLARLLVQNEDYESAVETLREGAKLDLTDFRLADQLARLLATCPESELRNAPEAIRLAERACVETDFANPGALSTLAAAYAESGDFVRAVSTAEAALQVAEGGKHAALAEEIQGHLDLYRAGQPLRQ